MIEKLKEVREHGNNTLIKTAILLIYWGAILFAEIMFIQIMASVFPTGLLRTFAIAGAVANGLTACIMPFAKDHYFSPGAMHNVGLGLWFLDVVVLFLNVLLAFETQQGITTGGMFSWWYDFSPASPLMAIITWGVLMVLSPEHEAHQKEMLRRNRLIDAYADHEFNLIEDGEVDDILTAGARANVKDLAEKIAKRKIRIAKKPEHEVVSVGRNGKELERVNPTRPGR